MFTFYFVRLARTFMQFISACSFPPNNNGPCSDTTSAEAPLTPLQLELHLHQFQLPLARLQSMPAGWARYNLLLVFHCAANSRRAPLLPFCPALCWVRNVRAYSTLRHLEL